VSFDRYIASVSFGKDSLAMVLLILERGLPLDEVVFYDTGMEFKAIKVAPLAKFGFTEADALAYCYDRGFFWEENGIRLYDVLDRVSCWCCANKNLKELRNIRTHLPKYWNRLKDLQSRTDRPMKGPGKSVFDLEERFGKEAAK
jgi:3'-phosphoadenosine 5'-phosphosulfate sulfotransferase (PAPS reductase)/FAD synthetase